MSAETHKEKMARKKSVRKTLTATDWYEKRVQGLKKTIPSRNFRSKELRQALLDRAQAKRARIRARNLKK